MIGRVRVDTSECVMAGLTPHLRSVFDEMNVRGPAIRRRWHRRVFDKEPCSPDEALQL